MNLRWTDPAKAERVAEQRPMGEHEGVATYVDHRLQPYFDENPLLLTSRGRGPLTALRLRKDKKFSEFVQELTQKIWDSPLQS